jgi:hypothetical protein
MKRRKEMDKRYKLVEQEAVRSENSEDKEEKFEWKLKKWKEIEGDKEFFGVFSEGWLHCYSDPLIAILLNPINENIQNPRLFEVEVDGKEAHCNMKYAYKKMRLMKEVNVPKITLEQKVKFAVLCALEICGDNKFTSWAKDWYGDKKRKDILAFETDKDRHEYEPIALFAYDAAISGESSELVPHATVSALTNTAYVVMLAENHGVNLKKIENKLLS